MSNKKLKEEFNSPQPILNTFKCQIFFSVEALWFEFQANSILLGGTERLIQPLIICNYCFLMTFFRSRSSSFHEMLPAGKPGKSNTQCG